MAVSSGPNSVETGLILIVDAANIKSFRGEPTTNLLPNPTINAYPTIGNGWGTYNTNQYGSGIFFSIGTVSSVSDNIVTMTANHSLRTYDVMQPQTTGGGVTANTNYFIKKISNTQFSLHAYNDSQDGSQGYINLSTGTHKVYDSIATDTRISINSTSFPTMWWGYPHLPNSGLVKEIISNGFTHPDTLAITDCIRLHYIRTDDVRDGMAYNVDAVVTAGQPVTVSFYHRSTDARAVGKSIQYQIYNYTGGSSAGFFTSFTLGAVGVWQRHTFTFTPTYTNMISYWFSISGGVYTWDLSNIQVEQKVYATAFVPGNRGATVATGGGWEDLSGNNNHGELINGVTYNNASGSSLVFDGTDDTITTPIPVTTLAALSNWTMECWVRIPSFPSAGPSSTIRKGVIMGATYYAGCAIYWAGNVSGTACNVYGYIRGNDNYRSTSIFSMAINTWYHFALVNNRTNTTLSLYVNGILHNSIGSATEEYNAGLITTAGNIGFNKPQIDGGGADTYSYLPCNVNATRIYTNALSPTQILENFNAFRARFNI
jgi:hypothetical protein